MIVLLKKQRDFDEHTIISVRTYGHHSYDGRSPSTFTPVTLRIFRNASRGEGIHCFHWGGNRCVNTVSRNVTCVSWEEDNLQHDGVEP